MKTYQSDMIKRAVKENFPGAKENIEKVFQAAQDNFLRRRGAPGTGGSGGSQVGSGQETIADQLKRLKEYTEGLKKKQQGG